MPGKFDALGLEVDQPRKMQVVHPTNRQPLRDADGNEAFIELYSGDSEIARKHNRTIQRRRLSMQRGTRIKISPEELETEATELLAALTTNWYLVSLDGQKIDVLFSAENARELYAAPPLQWLREQVDEFAADRGNYAGALSQS